MNNSDNKRHPSLSLLMVVHSTVSVPIGQVHVACSAPLTLKRPANKVCPLSSACGIVKNVALDGKPSLHVAYIQTHLSM